MSCAGRGVRESAAHLCRDVSDADAHLPCTHDAHRVDGARVRHERAPGVRLPGQRRPDKVGEGRGGGMGRGARGDDARAWEGAQHEEASECGVGVR